MIAIHILGEWLASFVEPLLFFSIIHTLSESRYVRKKHAILCFSILVAIATGVVLLNLIDISVSFPTVLYATISFALGASILYQGKFIEFLLASIGFVAYTLLLDMLSMLFLNQVGMGHIIIEITSGFSFHRICFISIVKTIQVITVSLFCGLIKKASIRLKMSKAYTVTIVCLVLGCVGSIYLVIQAKQLIGFTLNQFQMLLGVSCILLICTTYLLLRVQEIRKEKEYAEQQSKILEKNYQTAEQSYEANAKLYHDMRNHFALLQGYLADGKISAAQAYLESVNGEASYSLERWTGIGAIDYILSQKADIAKGQSIDISIHAEYPKDCKIEPVDLCTILTNLLDNAIEACEKQPKGADKSIGVTIRRIHQFIIIRVSNSSSVEPLVSNGIFTTSKKNRKNHGWGIRSVKSAVEKYQGTMEIDYDKTTFTVSVMLFYQ